MMYVQICTSLSVYSDARIGRFPVGTEDVPIFLDDLRCIGNESRLLDCQATPVGAHNCGHFEDAGAICQREWSLCVCVCDSVCLCVVCCV